MLASGDDHLDADAVILKAGREKRQRSRDRRAGRSGGSGESKSPAKSPAEVEKEVRRLERKREDVTGSLEAHEARLAEIDAAFCEEGFYDRTTPDEVSRLEVERLDTQKTVEQEMERWSDIEARLETLSSSA